MRGFKSLLVCCCSVMDVRNMMICVLCFVFACVWREILMWCAGWLACSHEMIKTCICTFMSIFINR